MKKGFTLIEIIIVVAIISILLAILLPQIGKVRDPAYDAARASNLQKVQTYLELYYTKNRNYPNVGISTWENLQTVLVGADIGVSAIPADPLANSGRVYWYCYSADAQSYILGAKFGTTGHSSLDDPTEIDSIAGYACTPQADCIDASNGFCVGF